LKNPSVAPEKQGTAAELERRRIQGVVMLVDWVIIAIRSVEKAFE
jgi:hypothetical protein